MRANFIWPQPRTYNIAEQICEAWARRAPEQRALTYLDAAGGWQDYSYRDLSRGSSRLANTLAAYGIGRKDRCAVLLPQAPETVLTHLACYKLGAIVVPLFTLFGEDGLRYRLQNSGAKAVVTNHDNLMKLMNIRDDLPELKTIFINRWSCGRRAWFLART